MNSRNFQPSIPFLIIGGLSLVQFGCGDLTRSRNVEPSTDASNVTTAKIIVSGDGNPLTEYRLIRSRTIDEIQEECIKRDDNGNLIVEDGKPARYSTTEIVEKLSNPDEPLWKTKDGRLRSFNEKLFVDQDSKDIQNELNNAKDKLSKLPESTDKSAIFDSLIKSQEIAGKSVKSSNNFEYTDRGFDYGELILAYIFPKTPDAAAGKPAVPKTNGSYIYYEIREAKTVPFGVRYGLVYVPQLDSFVQAAYVSVYPARFYSIHNGDGHRSIAAWADIISFDFGVIPSTKSIDKYQNTHWKDTTPLTAGLGIQIVPSLNFQGGIAGYRDSASAHIHGAIYAGFTFDGLQLIDYFKNNMSH